MLRRIGFRRLLPILQLVAYLLLVGPYSYETYKLTSQLESPDAHIIPVQETAEFHFEHIDRPAPLRVKFAGMLNLPVIVAAGIAFIPIIPEGTRGSVVWMICLTPFIALLWYGVGLWIDRRLDFVPQKPRIPSRLRCVAWSLILALSVALLFGVIGVFAIACAKLIDGTDGMDVARLAEFVLFYSPLALWSGFFFVVCKQGVSESTPPPA